MRLGIAKESGSFASLSASLLARKGQARPAMRPSVAHHEEDLGWNDMGHEMDAELVPAPVQYQAAIEAELGDKQADVVEALSEAPADETVRPVRIASRVTRRIKVRKGVGPVRAKDVAKGKVAFTLRLDGERHLRLRLGCTISNRSAQQIVTEALNAFLGGIPGIEELAAQIAPQDVNRQR